MTARERPDSAGTVSVRDGEEIDTKLLRAWMLIHAPALLAANVDADADADTDADAVVTVRQFPAGFSNLT